MEFLGMIAVGVLGLAACGRIFKLVFKLMGRGFDAIEDAALGDRKSRKRRYDDD